eukprot:411610-Rhodomonas_salina.1
MTDSESESPSRKIMMGLAPRWLDQDSDHQCNLNVFTGDAFLTDHDVLRLRPFIGRGLGRRSDGLHDSECLFFNPLITVSVPGTARTGLGQRVRLSLQKHAAKSDARNHSPPGPNQTRPNQRDLAVLIVQKEGSVDCAERAKPLVDEKS